jgi:hypothetical protein
MSRPRKDTLETNDGDLEKQYELEEKEKLYTFKESASTENKDSTDNYASPIKASIHKQ